MSNLAQLQAQCKANIEEAFLKAEAHFSIVIPRVPVVFSNKMTSSAGVAHANFCHERRRYVGTKITLSNQLMHANPEAFVKQTPGHEAAHIIDYTMNGSSSHGVYWKQIMSVIGLQAKRTHNMERPASVLKNRVEVFCGSEKSHQVTKQRVNKMRRGAGYRCKKCKQELTLTKANAPTVSQIDTMLAELVATTKAATKPKAKPKTKSKAEQVREIIRERPTASVNVLIDIVRSMDIIPAGNVKKYVTENVKRVRG